MPFEVHMRHHTRNLNKSQIQCSNTTLPEELAPMFLKLPEQLEGILAGLDHEPANLGKPWSALCKGCYSPRHQPCTPKTWRFLTELPMTGNLRAEKIWDERPGGVLFPQWSCTMSLNRLNVFSKVWAAKSVGKRSGSTMGPWVKISPLRVWEFTLTFSKSSCIRKTRFNGIAK